MAVNTWAVIRIIKELAEQANESLDFTGFGNMSDWIDSDAISQQYLDDRYRANKRYWEQGHFVNRTSRKKMDLIAKALGYKNFDHYERHIVKPLNEVLMNCVGNWWSIVRANYDAVILKAPIRIY